MAEAAKLSSAEGIKADSDYLRGTIVEELANDQDSFAKDTTQVLKHHGMYQQDNRDARGSASGKAFSMMVRVKVPGGVLTSEQFVTQLDLCDEFGNATLRLTDRQAIQFHGVLKRNVREHLRRVNAVQLTSLGACGDVQRNVLCCPAPLDRNGIRRQMQHTARSISDAFLPKTRAYHEIWLGDPATGQRELVNAEGQVEPVYGKTYLPRKFKVAMALPEDNCVDVHANDLGLLAIHDGSRLSGYNVLIGGGMGMTPSNKRTFPCVSQPMTFVTPEQVLAIVEAMLKVHRDHGNREDRKRARLKYVLADHGMEWVKQQAEGHFGGRLPDPRPVAVHEVDDHLGWHEQGAGRWFYGLNIENGRVLDRDGMTLKSALKEICRTLRPGIRLTALQSVLFVDLGESDRPVLEEILARHGIRRTEAYSTVRRWSMACVALPTCGLAVTESERALPKVMTALEEELRAMGLEGERFATHMTGCPNGCARPYTCDVGLSGRTVGKHAIYLGGSVLGNRLGFLYKDLVPVDEIVATLLPVFQCFKAQRRPGESLGDFCHRLGPEGLAVATA